MPFMTFPSTYTCWTVILFWVSVPVLSEQITDTQPRLSTAFNFLIIAFSFAIFWVPKAWTMVTMEVRASGMAATARATAKSSESRRVIFRNMQRANTSAQTIMISTASFPLN